MADQAAPLDSAGRAQALRRCVQPALRPRDVARRVGTGETQPGVQDRRCRRTNALARRATRRRDDPERASQRAQGRHLRPAAGARARDPQARREGQTTGHSRAARQDRSDGDDAGARADLGGGLPAVLLRVPAQPSSAGRHRAGAVLHQPAALIRVGDRGRRRGLLSIESSTTP
jgi:hypothetical protein